MRALLLWAGTSRENKNKKNKNVQLERLYYYNIIQIYFIIMKFFDSTYIQVNCYPYIWRKLSIYYYAKKLYDF